MKKAALGDLLKDFKPKKATGSWSKYGGGEYGLDKSHLDRWYCQACAEEQPEGCVGFMLVSPAGGYVRVCSKCFHSARTMEYSYRKVTYIVRYSHRREGES